VIAEDAGWGTILRRFVFGPGLDEPLVWYEGSGTSDRHWLHADERGSIIAVSNDSGAVTAIDRYDEYGVPQGTLAGPFGYTGQQWIPELGMYYYRARIYSATLGRFMQTDPIGYGGGMNVYAYVGNNPVNFRDPMGTCGFTNYAHYEAPQGPDGQPSGPWEFKYFFSRQDSECESPHQAHVLLAALSAFSNSDGARVACALTQSQIDNSGTVNFTANETHVAGLVAYGIIVGFFWTESGITGNFTSTSFGFGLGLSNSNVVGSSRSLGTFIGGNDTIAIALPNGLTGSLSQDLDGNVVGSSGGRGLGASMGRLLGLIGTIGASASASFTNTELLNVTCPG
jgi:RHS repeat-associated protein